MIAELPGRPGFALPEPECARRRHRGVALELVATLALTISLVVAATAVSLAKKSLAHANVIEPPAIHMPAARD